MFTISLFFISPAFRLYPPFLSSQRSQVCRRLLPVANCWVSLYDVEKVLTQLCKVLKDMGCCDLVIYGYISIELNVQKVYPW